MTFLLIHNATLIDGNGGEPMADAAVLVKDNTIQAVGRKAEIPLPDAAITMVDAQEGTLLPGLIDTHVHFALEGLNPVKRLTTPFSMHFYEAIDRMRRTLDAGITSVRDASGTDLGMKQAVEQGLIVGPRMQISVTMLCITGGPTDDWLPSGNRMGEVAYPGRPHGRCDGVNEVRRRVREVLRAGAEVIKVSATGSVLGVTDHPEFIQFTQEELEVMVQEGQFRRGTKVMAHAHGAQGIKNAVRAGVHSIEHGIYLDDECIELMLERGTFLVPTLLALASILEIKDGSIPEWGVEKARKAAAAHEASIAKAYKAGIKIAMGTDAGVMPHGTNLRELALMCKVGLSPMDAIIATTKTAAECLGWQDHIGTVEVGKLADMVVTKANPLTDITSLADNDNIVMVIKDGRFVKNRLAAE